MTVNLVVPAANSLLPMDGVDPGWAETGVRKVNHKDVLPVRIAEDSMVVGVFTQNRLYAAPAQMCRKHLASGKGTRATVTNTGNVSAGTGAPDLTYAHQTCDAMAELLDVSPEQVLPLSTNVILEPLPVDRITAGLSAVEASAKSDSWLATAGAIMTTDTVPKAASATYTLSGKTVRTSGVSKGMGMTRPNMATMLGFTVTDANMDDAMLQGLVRYVADHSFNSVTVDSDTSTNDSFVVVAADQASTPRIGFESYPDYAVLHDTLTGLAQELMQEIMRDGEGATEFTTIQVEGDRNVGECRLIAYAVAHSPLVKTVLYVSDPNLGCVLAVVGYVGMTDFDVNGVNPQLNDVWAAYDGGRNPSYREEDDQRVMKQTEITMRIALDRGDTSAIVWTCDFSHNHVSINADYRP